LPGHGPIEFHKTAIPYIFLIGLSLSLQRGLLTAAGVDNILNMGTQAASLHFQASIRRTPGKKEERKVNSLFPTPKRIL